MPQSDTAEPKLEAVNLSCVRGERVLFNQLDLSISTGRCVHIVGANGSGKTSLLRIIASINSPDSGVITWSNEDIRNNSAYLEQLAYIGHLDGLKNELTAAENLSAHQKLNGVFSESRVDQGLAQMGILECADLTANKLSFGQRRRLAFARLLGTDYGLWVLDEPFTGIDAAGRQLIEQICLQHLQSNGMIILTNHQDLSNSLLAPYLDVLTLAQPRPAREL